MALRPPHPLSRRAFLRASLASTASVLLLSACSGSAERAATAPAIVPPTAPAATPGAAPTPTAAPAFAQAAPTSPPAPAAATAQPTAQALPSTPACPDDDGTTPEQTEGPYFTPGSPERTSLLEPGMPGTRLVVSGFVLSTGCQPVARALLDFWQADDAGAYDNVGYRLRGHQFTDDTGRYTLETIVPGLYTGRTRHIHVKVQAPNRPVLTTQLYFPNEPANERDRIFNPALLLAIEDAADGKRAKFDFVLDLG